MKLIRADFIRLRKNFAFHLTLAGMLVLASVFMIMQATAMEYTVPLSRVIFLPLSMYGIAAAAFVSVFAGTDFSDGFIRNKLLRAECRSSLVISQIIVCCTAAASIYAAVTVFSAGTGYFFFENNIEEIILFRYFFIGLAMSVVTGCLFAVITLLCGNKTHAVIWCMGIAAVMLFLAMHTNSVLVQTEYKDGILNPHYVGGIRRIVYSILHDLNPCGQAAQLSSWQVRHPFRIIILDILQITFLCLAGCALFENKDIN